MDEIEDTIKNNTTKSTQLKYPISPDLTTIREQTQLIQAQQKTHK